MVFGRAIQAQEEAPYTRWVHDATGRTFHVYMRDGATTTQRMEPLRLVREHIDRQRRFVLAQAVSATVIDRPTRASSPSVPVSASRLRTHHLPNVSLNWGNFFHGDPGHADAIVCYLMPGVMAKLGNFLDKAVRPGTFVVTNTFLFRERRASAVRRRGLRGSVALYIWPGRHWTVKVLICTET